ncbi:hypothetical protein [Rhodoferax sp.]|uniref:hypothetical protein n=1 Tax=Rhodoferax sp. TaxID=50421 RepID=UPI00374C8B1C
MPTSHLRRIAISVDEPTPGKFYWNLTESVADIVEWMELDVSRESYATYREALMAGVSVLATLGSDEAGPRASGEDENASPVG